MPALDALRLALDVHQATARDVAGPTRALPAPVPAHRPTDRVTLSAEALALATASPHEGEPTDLEGALGSRPTASLVDPARKGSHERSPGAVFEPVHVDLFA